MITPVKCVLMIPNDILSIVLIITIVIIITTATLILTSIVIISSGIGSPRGTADGIESIPLNLGAIDIEASLFNAVVILLIIGDTKELETLRIGFSIICLFAHNVGVALQSKITLQPWLVVAWNASVGMILFVLQLAVTGVVLVAVRKEMEDG